MHHSKHRIPTRSMEIIAELRKAECPSLGSQPFLFKRRGCQSCPINANQRRQRAGHPPSPGTPENPHGHSEETFLPEALLTMHRERVLGKLLQSNDSKRFLGVNSTLTGMLRSEPPGWTPALTDGRDGGCASRNNSVL